MRRFGADAALSVAVLTGAGGRFCAGADLKAMREDGAPRASRMATLGTGELFGGLDDYASRGWRQAR